MDIPHCPEHPDAGLRLWTEVTTHEQRPVALLAGKRYRLGALEDDDIINTQDMSFLCAECEREIDIPEDWEEVP